LRLRQLGKEIVIYGLGDILFKATAVITLPIYTRLFMPADYGTWSYAMSAVGLCSSVLALGGDSAYARYFFEAKTQHEKQQITSTWMIFLAGWSLGGIALCLPFVDDFSQWSLGHPEQRGLYVLALLAVPFSLINQLCGQVLRNQFHARLFTTLNALTVLLTVGLSLFAVIVLQGGIVGLVSGALAAAVVMLPVRLWTARTMLRPVFSLWWLRHLLAYGVPLVPTTMAYWIFGASDRFLLGTLFSFEQVGLYTVATSLTSVLALANSALGQAWSPHAVRVYAEQRALAPIFYGRVMTYLLAGFGLLCVGCTTFAREVLVLLSAPPFYAATLAVGPLALGCMASASTQITALGITLSKKTVYFSVYAWLAALLNLGLNIWLIPKWGMVAAAWTTALAYTTISVAYCATSQRLCPIVYEKRPVLTAIGLTLTFTIAAPLLPGVNLIAGLVLKGLYCLAYVGLLYVLHVIEHSEWQRLFHLVYGYRIGRVQPTG
jgi:O-antigen/teichoic acid export membrane protein